MTIAGLIWSLMALICFAYPNIKYLLSLTMIGMTLQCVNVVQISGQGIGPQVVTSLLFVLRVAIERFPIIKLPNRKNRLLIDAMLLILAAAMISIIRNGLLASKWLVFMQLLIYILCYISMIQISHLIDEEFIFRLIKGLAIFLLGVGIVQLLITTNVVPRISIISQLLFNEERGAVYYYHNNYMRITSAYMEPSYYSGFVVGVLYYIMERGGFRKNKLLIAVIVFEIIFTFSSTAYAIACIVGVIYIALSDLPMKKKAVLIAVAVAFAGVMYFGFFNVLDKVLFSKGTSGSANKRNNMNIRAFNDFFEEPIFGHGYKNYRASSIIFCILAETGLFGFTAYFLMFISVVKRFFNNDWISKKGKKAILFSVICGFFAQFIACPDLDLCTFWLWIYFLGLYHDPRYQDTNIKIEPKNNDKGIRTR